MRPAIRTCRFDRLFTDLVALLLGHLREGVALPARGAGAVDVLGLEARRLRLDLARTRKKDDPRHTQKKTLEARGRRGNRSGRRKLSRCLATADIRKQEQQQELVMEERETRGAEEPGSRGKGTGTKEREPGTGTKWNQEEEEHGGGADARKTETPGRHEEGKDGAPQPPPGRSAHSGEHAAGDANLGKGHVAHDGPGPAVAALLVERKVGLEPIGVQLRDLAADERVGRRDRPRGPAVEDKLGDGDGDKGDVAVEAARHLGTHGGGGKAVSRAPLSTTRSTEHPTTLQPLPRATNTGRGAGPGHRHRRHTDSGSLNEYTLVCTRAHLEARVEDGGEVPRRGLGVQLVSRVGGANRRTR